MPATNRAKKPKPLVPRAKVWLEQNGEYVCGHGLCQILAAISQTGSIKEAAAKLGKSYRHVWSRVKEAEEAIGEKLVDAHVGGRAEQRSELTPRARELMTAFVELRQAIFEMVEREFHKRF
jgi:molybdate transport system regulatory protein